VAVVGVTLTDTGGSKGERPPGKLPLMVTDPVNVTVSATMIKYFPSLEEPEYVNPVVGK
jgi:hypothetical protein